MWRKLFVGKIGIWFKKEKDGVIYGRTHYYLDFHIFKFTRFLKLTYQK